MERIDIRLKESDRQILKSIIGKTLDCIEHDEFTFTDSSSQVVKISSYGETIFLYSFVEALDFYGSTECFLQEQFGENCRIKWRILHLQNGESCKQSPDWDDQSGNCRHNINFIYAM